MTDTVMTDGAIWLAAGFACAAFATAVAAALSRALFAACLYVCASGVCVAVAAMALGAADASLALMIIGGGWAPIILLACVLLASRVTKLRRRSPPWLSIAAAASVAGAVVWSAHGHTGGPVSSSGGDAGGIWFAAMALVTGAGCLALLGFGERGALQRKPAGGGK